MDCSGPNLSGSLGFLLTICDGHRPPLQIKKAGWGNPSGFFLSCLRRAQSPTIRVVTQHRTDDLRISGLNPLISPAVLAYYLPLAEHASEIVTRRP